MKVFIAECMKDIKIIFDEEILIPEGEKVILNIENMHLFKSGGPESAYYLKNGECIGVTNELIEIKEKAEKYFKKNGIDSVPEWIIEEKPPEIISVIKNVLDKSIISQRIKQKEKDLKREKKEVKMDVSPF